MVFRKGIRMKKYELNEGTMAILPEEGRKTKVYEDSTTFQVDKSPYEIMEDSCEYFGSTYLGRQTGSQNMLGNGYKVPIIVEESKGMIFFPTISPLNEECWWISLNHIEQIERDGDNTKIFFDSGLELSIPISYRSIQNQLLRATRLQSILNKRLNR